MSWLKKKQEEDERSLAIKCILRNESYENYFVENNIMKRIENNQNVIISKCLQMEVIRNIHDNIYFDVKKINIIKEYYISRKEIKGLIAMSCIIANRKAGEKKNRN